jgi:hypothetical protein
MESILFCNVESVIEPNVAKKVLNFIKNGRSPADMSKSTHFKVLFCRNIHPKLKPKKLYPWPNSTRTASFLSSSLGCIIERGHANPQVKNI